MKHHQESRHRRTQTRWKQSNVVLHQQILITYRLEDDDMQYVPTG